jgi:hypothetical protein
MRRANDRDVAQHLDIAPKQSQHNYFDSVMIQTLQEATREPLGEYDIRLDPITGDPIGLVPMEKGPVKLWILPAETDKDGVVTALPPDVYGMGCDISSGSGASNSVCSVGAKTTGRKVCEACYHNLDPRDFALVAIALGRLFKSYDGTAALMNWEVNGPGGLFGRILKEKRYTRLFLRESKDMLKGNTIGEIPGYAMGVPGAKRNLLDQYTIALRDRLFVNLSYDAFEDCKAYRFSDTKDTIEHPKDAGGPDPSGARSNHGDRVFADALCVASLKRLGMGKVSHEVDYDADDKPVVVGTLEWRMKLAKESEGGNRRTKPIRAMRSMARRRWK